MLWKAISAHVQACKRAYLHTHTHTHTHVPKVLYKICCPGFPHCNCQTINPAKQVCIKLVKLIHNLIIRSLLIIGKNIFKVFIGQLKAFWTLIWAKFQNSFLETLKLVIPRLWHKSHAVINKNIFQGTEYSELSQATFCT